MEFNLGDAVSLRCKISPRILSGCDELKVIVNLRSRLFFSERKGTRTSRKPTHMKDPGEEASSPIRVFTSRGVL